MARYIELDALVAEIERRVNFQNKDRDFNYLQIKELEALLSYLDTLEIKEVDLDFQRFAKEMETVFALPSSKTKNTEEEPLNWEYAIAKHFYSLGLKAQKG